MRKYLLTGLVALGCASGAQAAPPPTIIFTPDNFALPGFTSATVFEDFENGGANGTQYTPATQANPEAAARGFGESVTGVATIFNGSLPPRSADPQPVGGNKYLTIENGSFTVTLGSGVSFFSFILGSIDSYNTVRLNYADGDFDVFSGQQIVGAAAPGPFNSSVNGRVSYDTGSGPQIVSAVFSSTQAALEIDGLAAAVPEPGTWAMMILGFGLIGSQLRSRKTRTKVSFA